MLWQVSERDTGERFDIADIRTVAPHDASLTCDLVMKGGITSGVVYPAAVCVWPSPTQ